MSSNAILGDWLLQRDLHVVKDTVFFCYEIEGCDDRNVDLRIFTDRVSDVSTRHRFIFEFASNGYICKVDSK